MAQTKRILLIAGEVTPFAEISELADLIRHLPESLADHGDFEARVTMPRYGTINERSNRLHEVIRLSGTDISMGDAEETLTVKVASIPDTRVQVYFMDHDDYFGRAAVAHDDNGAAFADNAERALFYNRSVLETISNLRWGPDVIHAFGWVGALAPLLLNTEYAANETLNGARVVYTPDHLDTETHLTADFADRMDIQLNGASEDIPLSTLGKRQAHAVIHASADHASAQTANGEASVFPANRADRGKVLVDLYDDLLREVPA